MYFSNNISIELARQHCVEIPLLSLSYTIDLIQSSAMTGMKVRL